MSLIPYLFVAAILLLFRTVLLVFHQTFCYFVAKYRGRGCARKRCVVCVTFLSHTLTTLMYGYWVLDICD